MGMLVITIIVMLILAGVSISAALSDDGVATNATKAALKTKLSKVEEDFTLAISNVQMGYESAKTEASSISAYKGVYFTDKKFNDVLKESKIIREATAGNKDSSPTFIKSNLNKTQVDLVGTTTPTVQLIKDNCYSTKEYPVAQLAYPGAKNGSNNITSKDLNVSDKYIALYLSNGRTAQDIGADVFVAVCKIDAGIPIMVDIGLVESDITSENLQNGLLTMDNGTVQYETNGENTTMKKTTNGGTLPASVKWLHNSIGLKNVKENKEI